VTDPVSEYTKSWRPNADIVVPVIETSCPAHTTKKERIDVRRRGSESVIVRDSIEGSAVLRGLSAPQLRWGVKEGWGFVVFCAVNGLCTGQRSSLSTSWSKGGSACAPGESRRPPDNACMAAAVPGGIAGSRANSNASAVTSGCAR